MPATPRRVGRVSDYVLAVAALTLAGFLLRVALLDRVPIWRDEAFTAVVVRQSWGRMFDVVAHDSAPPLSYILVKLANQISGSVTSLRMVAVLAGVAAIPVGAALGRRLAGEWGGIGAGAMTATLPSLVLLARDLRMYSLAALFVAGATLALWRAVERPEAIRLAVYALCVAGGLLTHYVVAIGLVAGAASALLWLRPGAAVALRCAGAGAVGALALLPWALYASAQFSHAASPFWAGSPSLSGLGTMLAYFAGGAGVDRANPVWQGISGLVSVSVIAGGLSMLGAAIWAWMAGAQSRRGAAYLASVTGLTVVFLALVSMAKPIFDARYAMPAVLPLIAVAGAGLVQRRRLAMLLPLVLAIAALPIAVNVTNPDIPAVVAHLYAEVRPGDEIVVTGARDYFPMRYYLDPQTGERLLIVSRGGLRWFDGTADIPSDHVFRRIPDGGGRIFVIGKAGFSDPLPAGYVRHERYCVILDCIQEFERPTQSAGAP